MQNMKLFDDSIITTMPVVSEVPQTPGWSWNGNTLALVGVVFMVVFFWFKYNEKQRRLIVEAQARRQQELYAQYQQSQHQQFELNRQMQTPQVVEKRPKQRERLPGPVGFSLNRL
jgi:Tfp pilus assembly protein PilO